MHKRPAYLSANDIGKDFHSLFIFYFLAGGGKPTREGHMAKVGRSPTILGGFGVFHIFLEDPFSSFLSCPFGSFFFNLHLGGKQSTKNSPRLPRLCLLSIFPLLVNFLASWLFFSWWTTLSLLWVDCADHLPRQGNLFPPKLGTHDQSIWEFCCIGKISGRLVSIIFFCLRLFWGYSRGRPWPPNWWTRDKIKDSLDKYHTFDCSPIRSCPIIGHGTRLESQSANGWCAISVLTQSVRGFCFVGRAARYRLVPWLLFFFFFFIFAHNLVPFPCQLFFSVREKGRMIETNWMN